MAETTNKPYTLICLRHSGTHLIQPIMRRLTGSTVYAPKGSDAINCTPSAKCVVFLRDPRNTIISHTRYKASDLQPGKADKRIAKLITKRKSGIEGPIEHMTAWARRWARSEGTLIVRFEDLVSDKVGQVTRVRDYLGGGDVDDAIEYTFGKSGTWTGRHSQWREWFGPLALDAWNANGGPRLLKAMGYGGHDD